MSTVTANMNGTKAEQVKAMLEHRAELVAEYGRTAGASKAAVGRKINECQLDLFRAGAKFDLWEPPVAYTTRYVLSEDELAQEVLDLRAVLANPDAPEIIRHTADQQLVKYTKQAERREIDVSFS